MTGIILLFLVRNSFLFSLIFWILTFLSKSVFSNLYSNYKLNFYECGFKSLNKVRVSYEINFLLLILLIILYDSEFLILIPFALNISIYSLEVSVSLIVFLFWFLLSFLFDFFLNALDWQISWNVLHYTIYMKKL